MSRRLMKCVVLMLMLAALTLSALPAAAQPLNPLDYCREGAFSTEEDFIMLQKTPFDGNIYVSDGDLLSTVGGEVCARNNQLTRRLRVPGRFDLGLDAVDILRFGTLEPDNTGPATAVIAFSTELDHPRGLFTAGDLLLTHGGIIPNRALTFAFSIPHDIGLDGLQIVGSPESIRRFINLTGRNAPSIAARDSWLNGRLQNVLKRLEMDIWFSVEGSWLRGENLILDGDILSARDGVILVRHSQLLPGITTGPYPTDPRIRGVDFGVDAIAAQRDGQVQSIHFSTEILYKNPELGFFDGDVLQIGGAVRFTNEQFVAPFVPAVFYLGLDALWLPLEAPVVGQSDGALRGN